MKSFATTIIASSLLASSSLYASEAGSQSSQCDNYDVYVMRHLPKADVANKDPELNELGQKMALVLADSEFMVQVDAGFSTDYQRTRQTLAPSAERHGFEVHIYDPRDNQSLMNIINEQYCGKTIAIVGHSNTTPAIVTALGGTFEVSFAGEPLPANTQVQLDESDYGAVFHVKKEQGAIEQDMFRLK
ncbi:SixA phosphatase family protein [Kangiella sp. M94]